MKLSNGNSNKIRIETKYDISVMCLTDISNGNSNKIRIETVNVIFGGKRVEHQTAIPIK